LNDKTLLFREALKEGIKVVLAKNADAPQDPVIALGWALYTKGIAGHPECLVRLAEWIGGKPKEVIEFDPPIGGGPSVIEYRCFTAEGRSVSPPSVSVPGKVPKQT
jgi:hypothetical protein